ncbi:hypothetical protein [Fodinicola feengrottensis]|uniref:hypothetical protein n=1 Tax=Fodinicola feengrottensis TaxID=435914 RepID=UPI0013D780E4|nr:hypothetical protein [Fodinicola feengrottensis]
MIGDRGPGFPSDHGIMLDIDGETYAQLTGGHWNTETHLVDGFGPGHIQVTYVITEWGTGTGVKGLPEPFSTGAWRVHDSRPNLPAPTVVPPVTGPAKSQSLVEHTVVADANTSAVVGVASHHALVADPVVAPASVCLGDGRHRRGGHVRPHPAARRHRRAGRQASTHHRPASPRRDDDRLPARFRDVNPSRG